MGGPPVTGRYMLPPTGVANTTGPPVAGIISLGDISSVDGLDGFCGSDVLSETVADLPSIDGLLRTFGVVQLATASPSVSVINTSRISEALSHASKRHSIAACFMQLAQILIPALATFAVKSIGAS